MRNPDLSRELATDRLARLRRDADRARTARGARSRTRAPMTLTRFRALLTPRRKSYPRGRVRTTPAE
jgi:hypothetical protein